jgi:hypothetical protein
MKYSALVRQATGNALAIAFQHEERISHFISETSLRKNVNRTKVPTMLVLVLS